MSATDVELSEESLEALGAKAQRGALIRDWMRMPAAKAVEAEMERMAGKAGMHWLLVSDEEAARIRAEAQGLAKFFAVVKKLILEGDAASQRLNNRAQDSTPGNAG